MLAGIMSEWEVTTTVKISELFDLKKSQYELDFVDINPDIDTPLFLDPYYISKCEFPFAVCAYESITVKPPYLPYGKKRKLSLSSFKNDLFILHLCRNCLFWRLPSQCFQLFQVCMDLPLCIKLIVVFCPKILIFHTVFQDMINRY